MAATTPPASTKKNQSDPSPSPASFLNTALPISRNLQTWLEANDAVKGKCVLDLGSGEGALVKHCISIGCDFGLGIDISLEAVERARSNLTSDKRAHFACLEIAQHDEIVDFVKSSTGGRSLEVVVCNAAQIPLAKPLENGYFVGKDGRLMIDQVIDFAAKKLPKDGALYMGHTSLSNYEKTVKMAIDMGLQAAVIPGSYHTFTLYPEVRTDAVRNYLLENDFPLGENDEVEGCLVRITAATDA